MRRATIERDRFDSAVRGKQDRAPGRLVDAPRLHAHKAILDKVELADAMWRAKPVQLGQERCGRKLLTIDRDRSPRSNPTAITPAYPALRRDNGARIDIVWDFLRRILQQFSFRRRVQQVRIDRKGRFAAFVFGERNLMLLGESISCRASADPTPATARHITFGSSA